MEARVHGGLGIVNAIGSGGFGAAAAIDLETRVHVRPCESFHATGVVRGERISIDSSIVEATVSVVEEHLGISIGPICVFEETEIPLESGLKGSSAFINALIVAILHLVGRADLGLLEVAQLGVRAARRAGLTVTGALDDHLATLGCGGYATDNRRRELVLHNPALEGHVAILYWARHRLQDIDVHSYSRYRSLYEAAWRLVTSGYWWKAALVNGIANAMALGLGGETIKLLVEAANGVLGAGVSGKGPSVYVVADTAKEARRAVMRLREVLGGEILETRLIPCKIRPLNL